MTPFSRLLAAEGLKLRRAPAWRVVWMLPLLFVALQALVVERPFLALPALTPQVQATLEGLPLKSLVAFWAGVFYPLAVALVPALLFRPEHRFKAWRHLHSQPVARRGIYLAKAAWALLLCTIMLALVGLLLWAERKLLGFWNPALALPFHEDKVVRVLGWLWLSTLPLLAFYLWVSDRINSLAVPVVFGLAGLLLTIALAGQELPQPWRRDLIPWVLPYAAAEQVMRQDATQQQAHVAGKEFQQEANSIRLPSGKKIRTWQNIPDEVLFPPPPPTPVWLLGSFSACAGPCFSPSDGWMRAEPNLNTRGVRYE
ncbi:MAG: ABC transporter permease [Holophagaceae bacterium]|nr:ABC transporter permease [Holophagaceae bacterium]